VNMPLPGLLRDVMGVTLKDYVPIYTEKVGVAFEQQLAGREGQCGLWADLLVPESATVLAKYVGAYEGAAITMNAFGKGKAVYIGADLDGTSLSRVIRTLLEMAGSKSEFTSPPAVEITRRRAGGREWVFALNHSNEGQKITVSGTFTSVLDKKNFDRELELKPYEVVVLKRS